MRKDVEQMHTYPRMVCNVLNIFIPSMIGMLAHIFVELINLHFIGKLGDAVMISGVGLGNTYVSTIGQTILTGLNIVVGTLVSQSHGANDIFLCGVYLNKGRITGVIFSCIITVLMLLCVPLFRILHLDEMQSYHASVYIYNLIPFVWFLF